MTINDDDGNIIAIKISKINGRYTKKNQNLSAPNFVGIHTEIPI